MLGCGVSGVNQVATLDCIFPLMTNLIYWFLLFSGTVAIALIILSGFGLSFLAEKQNLLKPPRKL